MDLKNIALDGKKRENQNRYIYKNPKCMHIEEYAF